MSLAELKRECQRMPLRSLEKAQLEICNTSLEKFQIKSEQTYGKKKKQECCITGKNKLSQFELLTKTGNSQKKKIKCYDGKK